MSVSLKNKKLLIMGGGSGMVGVTKLAQSMGLKVYVTDYYDTLRSPAKLVADVSADISIADIDALVAYIKENEIDGVLTGFTDSYLEYYLEVCEKAGLPHYGSPRAIQVATDKMVFKQACRDCGVGVIPGTNAYDYATVESFAKENGYPLMLKPTDNSGSRGVIKCESPSELKNAYEYAMSFSKAKNIIVEKFMDCLTIVSSYQFAGTEAYLSAFCDRTIYQSEEDGSAITHEARYPSKYLDRYIKEVDGPMKELFKKNGFSDGTVGVMGFMDDNGFYMCEMTYRPSGGHHYTLIDDQNGVNGLALLIEFAVTGEVASYDHTKEDPYFHDVCGMIHIVGQPEGVIAKMDGVESIEALPYVIEVCQERNVGQTIGKSGTTAQTLVSVWLKASDWKEYDVEIEEIKSMLKVYDSEGRSLVIRQ